MNTCGTCKYFGEACEISRYDDDVETVTHYHVCDLVKQINGYGDDEVPFRQYLAGVKDGSGYFAALCVTDEFGCNQWAAAETEAKS